MSLEERISQLTSAVEALNISIKVLSEKANFTAAGVQVHSGAAVAASPAATSAEPAPADEKKPRGRPAGSTNKPKDTGASTGTPAAATVAATAAPQPEPEAEFDPFGDSEPAVEAKPARTYTIAEITDGLKKLHTSGAAGKTATIGILAGLGVKGVAEIKEDKYAHVANELAKHGIAI